MKRPNLKLIKRTQYPESIDIEGNITREIVVDKGGLPRYLQATAKSGHHENLCEADLMKNLDRRRWLNAREMAIYLGTTVNSIRALAQREKIVAYKPFGKLLFDREEVDRMIESKRRLAWYEKD